MSILYLLTAPPPIFEGTDAVLQDVAALRAAFGGEIVNLSPPGSSIPRFPRQLCGLHKIAEIKRLEGKCKINHIFFSFPYPFPVLRMLRNPTFYTVTATLDPKRKPRNIAQLLQLNCIIVSNDRDAGILASWGLKNYAVVPAGIDTAKLLTRSTPLERELTLLMASAPWTRRQFELKGIDLLLEVVAKLPFLRVVLLWRGVLVEELIARIKRLGIEKSVEIVNQKVNVSDYLGKVHATIVLAKSCDIVKSFPHSLIESLVTGKPVLISDTIAMSDYVSERRCGVVIRDMTIAGVTSAIERLRRGYNELAYNALQVGSAAFSIEQMTKNHRKLYGL